MLNDDAVVDYLLKDQSVFNLDIVSEMTNLSKEEIRKDILERIKTYPVNDYTKKYAQFLFWERSCKWLLHGEDRNRYYFWNAAPFYSLPLVNYAMQIPDDQKKNKNLYRKVMTMLSKEVVKIEDNNFNAPLDTLEYRLKLNLYDFFSLFPRLRGYLLSMIRGETNYNYDINIARVLQIQTKKIDRFDNILSIKKLKEISKVYYIMNLYTLIW